MIGQIFYTKPSLIVNFISSVYIIIAIQKDYNSIENGNVDKGKDLFLIQKNSL